MLQTDELVGMEHCWNDADGEIRRRRRKICPIVILPTRLCWPDLEPDLRGERSAICCAPSEVCFFIYTIFRDLTGLPFQVAYCHLGERARYVIFLFLVVISVVLGLNAGLF